jgi:hypothetical protein
MAKEIREECIACDRAATEDFMAGIEALARN